MTPSDEQRALDEGRVWSFLRRILEQGAAIQQDYATGKYPSYEHYSARVDQAARERGDEFMAMLVEHESSLQSSKGSVVDGFVLVPVEPTEAMERAALKAEADFMDKERTGAPAGFELIYKAMIAAAPKPDGQSR